MPMMEAEAGPPSGQGVGPQAGTPPAADDDAVIATQHVLLPAGQAQVANDVWFVVGMLEGQKEAVADLSRRSSALGARVAALEQGPAKHPEDIASSPDYAEGASQRATFARSPPPYSPAPDEPPLSQATSTHGQGDACSQGLHSGVR